jgi:hypothetical protein
VLRFCAHVKKFVFMISGSQTFKNYVCSRKKLCFDDLWVPMGGTLQFCKRRIEKSVVKDFQHARTRYSAHVGVDVNGEPANEEQSV